jgi:hypothetical protein
MLCKCGCGFDAGFKKSGANHKERMFLDTSHRLKFYASRDNKSNRKQLKIDIHPELKEIYNNIRLCRKKDSQLLDERKKIVKETENLLYIEKEKETQYSLLAKKYSIEMRVEI